MIVKFKAEDPEGSDVRRGEQKTGGRRGGLGTSVGRPDGIRMGGIIAMG